MPPRPGEGIQAALRRADGRGAGALQNGAERILAELRLHVEALARGPLPPAAREELIAAARRARGRLGLAAGVAELGLRAEEEILRLGTAAAGEQLPYGRDGRWERLPSLAETEV